MKVYEIPLTLAEHDSDIKIQACFVAQISGERLKDHWSSGFEIEVYFTSHLDVIRSVGDIWMKKHCGLIFR